MKQLKSNSLEDTLFRSLSKFQKTITFVFEPWGQVWIYSGGCEITSNWLILALGHFLFWCPYAPCGLENLGFSNVTNVECEIWKQDWKSPDTSVIKLIFSLEIRFFIEYKWKSTGCFMIFETSHLRTQIYFDPFTDRYGIYCIWFWKTLKKLTGIHWIVQILGQTGILLLNIVRFKL